MLLYRALVALSRFFSPPRCTHVPALFDDPGHPERPYSPVSTPHHGRGERFSPSGGNCRDPGESWSIAFSAPVRHNRGLTEAACLLPPSQESTPDVAINGLSGDVSPSVGYSFIYVSFMGELCSLALVNFVHRVNLSQFSPLPHLGISADITARRSLNAYLSLSFVIPAFTGIAYAPCRVVRGNSCCCYKF